MLFEKRSVKSRLIASHIPSDPNISPHVPHLPPPHRDDDDTVVGVDGDDEQILDLDKTKFQREVVCNTKSVNKSYTSNFQKFLFSVF